MASGGEFGSGEPGTGGEAAAAHGPGVGGNRFGSSALRLVRALSL
jgi:hypothetical protein